MPKHVVITGGSSGIGATLVRRFAADGSLVAFTYHTHAEEARALASETGALAFPCDVRNEGEVQSASEAILRLFHRADVLINNAGTAQREVLEAMTLAQWDDQMAVHLRGAFLWSRALLPGLRETRGAIVNIASIWGEVGAACETAYSAAKAGLIGLTKALAKEAAPEVRVNAVAPGVIQTPMIAGFTPGELENLEHQIPLARLGTPEDVAAAAAFLASSDASYITGQVLAVNGGMRI